MQIHFPERDAILNSSDAEFAQTLLSCMYEELNSQASSFNLHEIFGIDNGKFLRHNAAIRIAQASVRQLNAGYNADQPDDIKDKAMASMSWLEKNGYIAPAFGQDGLYQITDIGKQAASHLPDLPLFDASLLPFEQLHPKLQPRAWHDFVRGDYSGAIFKAFQEVEISVSNFSITPCTHGGIVRLPEMRSGR